MKVFIVNNFLFILYVISFFLFFHKYGYTSHWEQPISSSNEMMHLAGELHINDNPAKKNDEVAVFDSYGQLVGLYILDKNGQYGDLVVWIDSALTPDIDEGCSPDDELSICVWEDSTSQEFCNDDAKQIIPSTCSGPYCPPDSLPLSCSSGVFYLLNITVAAEPYYCDDDDDGYVDLLIDGTCFEKGCEPQGCQMVPGDDCDDRPDGEDGLSGTVDDGVNINPEVPEVCGDGIDNDCNDLIDAEDPYCNLPDLVVTSVNNPPKRKKSGSKFVVKDTVKNQGEVSANKFTMRHYLSSDKFKGKKDIRLKGNSAISALAPGESSNGKTIVKIPIKTRPGKYYVITCGDDKKEVNEGDETNNCTASSKKIKVKKR